MATRSQKKSVKQQFAIWLLLAALALSGMWLAFALLDDFWLLIILWANG